ncbi:cyclic nucleotide-binding domain-containing protein 2-like [Elysia marginata]|uniref:Cyclic nucleotide-binding domain-containing protein 2-like n=1 Tax=Elysia marginata TaxID=1093978 RepID=A0AAV4JTY5_9GAST|nr:cyclic nucleotide-binding domain-containing protein 2-like [Elysia marginata]
MVLEKGEAFAKPVAYLTKGQTFGELAIINRSKRQSSIIAREESQFLTISIDDYHDIFMAGGVKTMTDPDHDEFLNISIKNTSVHLNLKQKKITSASVVVIVVVVVVVVVVALAPP